MVERLHCPAILSKPQATRFSKRILQKKAKLPDLRQQAASIIR
jgi:hypothetical protein